jgi:serine/threonine protein kinase
MISKTNSSFRKIFKDGKISEDEVDKKITSWENIVGMKTIKEIFQHHPELSDLLMKCLEIDPNNRINCMNALNHPFFKIEYS